MMTDPIADLLTRIRNASSQRAPSVDIPYSRLKEAVCQVLTAEGYLVQFEVLGEVPTKVVRAQLKYGMDGEKLIESIRRISKPGRRVYLGADEMRPVLGGMGIRVLSTSKGVISDREARTRHIGGEVLCEIY